MTKPVAPPDLWAKLEAARAAAGLSETPDIPADAFTVAEYCERYQVGDKTARCQLDKLVRTGAVQKGQRFAQGSDGRRVLVRVYWVAQ